MSWIEISLNTTDEAVDWVRSLLATNHYTGDLQITKYSQADSESLGEETLPPAWAFTIRLYVPYEVGARARVEAIADLFSSLHRTGLASEVETTIVEQKPAVAEPSSPFMHRIGQRFVVLPPDAAYQPAADEIILNLGASLAFGSGLHPATVLSLKLLERYVVPSMQVLDFGSGSGILSVAIARLGAQVLALDNDPVAVAASQDAVYQNSLEHQVTVRLGSLEGGSQLGHWMGGTAIAPVPAINTTASFDLIVANIPARMQIALVDDFRSALRKPDAHPGILITAGFTRDRENEVTTALTSAGFDTVDRESINEWSALAYRLG